MNPNQSLKIELVDKHGAPVEVGGVFFVVCFFMSSVYRFGFRTPATDENGVVSVSYDYLEQLRKGNLEYQPMDFKTALDECDPVVVVKPPSAEDMQEAWKTVHRFKATERYEEAKSWLHSSNEDVHAEETKVKMGLGQTVARIPCRLD